ncbi:MAG: O-antigen ligase domain-containing protein [Chloroflexi bacterium]|nr:MAG: O-antigen ligase domain-containing protein [Chloroflexota bacterium]
MAVSTSSEYVHNPARYLAHSFAVRTLVFLSLHVPLALVLSRSGWAGLVHGGFVLLLGLWAAMRQRAATVLAVLGYIAGAEVLWRMTGAKLLWEYGKYASLLIVGAALLVEWRKQEGEKRPFNPIFILYVILLLPAAIPPLAQFGLLGARNDLSFNLAGHLALAGLALYMWQRTMTRKQLTKLLLVMVAPIIGITFLALYSTLTTEIAFTLESNFNTSGGFGPNQTSNILGLGALAGVLFITLRPKSTALRFIVSLITIGFIVQSLLTFSRGGMFSFILAALTFGFYLLPTPRARQRFILLLGFATMFAIFVLLPVLNSFTGGFLQRRFTDTNSTGRIEAMQADWQAFIDHPVVGTGIGLSVPYREALLGVNLEAHTEFTRMAAEHGILGLVALILLLANLFQRIQTSTPGLHKALTAALIVWSLTVMLQNAMRLVAVSFVLSLAMLAWNLTEVGNEDE